MFLSRKWILASLALAPSLCGFYYWDCHAAALTPALSDETLRDWPPDAAVIRQEIGPLLLNSARITKMRREQFARLFNQRYRSHQPALAVCLRFMSDASVKLMCPAHMEPWKLDRLAQAAWSETREDFGREFNIDIYETYIGAANVKIGEIRSDPNHPQVARIQYCYPARPQNVSSAL